MLRCSSIQTDSLLLVCREHSLWDSADFRFWFLFFVLFLFFVPKHWHHHTGLADRPALILLQSAMDKLKHVTVRPTAAKRSSFVLPSRHWDGTTNFFFCFFVFCFSSPQSSGTNQMGVKLTTRHLFLSIYIFQVAVSHYETNSTLSKSQRSTAAVERAFCIFPGL